MATPPGEGAATARPPAPPLPLSLKVCFGAPGFAGAAMSIPIAVLMPRFYSDVVLAPLGAIAIGIALARAFDALTDPLMGWISDRTHTRFGRRKPWIAPALPFTAAAFYALFAPPAAVSGIDASLWFGGAFAAFFLFATVLEIPYAALGAEVSDDYHERSSLFGYRSLFIAAGTMAAAVLPTVLARTIPDEREAYARMAQIYGVVLVLLFGLLLWRVPERREYAERESNPLVPGVRRALRNRPFRVLLIAGVVSAIPAAIPAILLPYFVEYVLQPSDPGTMVGLYLLLYLGSGLLCVPFWMGVAHRAGKLRALVAASAVGIAGSVVFFFAGPGELVFAGVVYAAAGTASMAGSFLIPAMAADVIDYDELRTGRRREAQYTSFWALIPKFVAIPGSSVPLAILAAVGYVPNQPQSDEVLLVIRFLYSVFPAAFYLVALWVVSRYPISEAVHAEIREGIASLAAGGSADDPLTGESLSRSGGDEAEGTAWFLDHFSPGELRRLLRRGPRAVGAHVGACVVASLAVLACAAWAALSGVSGLETRPPVRTVLAVVVGGLALAAAAFHALRVGPARRLARATPPDRVIRAHLARVEAGRARVP